MHWAFDFTVKTITKADVVWRHDKSFTMPKAYFYVIILPDFSSKIDGVDIRYKNGLSAYASIRFKSVREI